MKSFFRTPEKRKVKLFLLVDLACMGVSLLSAFMLQMAMGNGLSRSFEPIFRLPLFAKTVAIFNLALIFLVIVLAFGGLCLLVFYVAGLYEVECIISRKRIAVKLGTAIAVSQFLAFLLSRLLFRQMFLPQIWAFHAVILFLLLWAMRLRVYRRMISREPFKILVIGTNGQDNLSTKAIDYLSSNGSRSLFEFSYCPAERFIEKHGAPGSNGNRFELIVYPFQEKLPRELLNALVTKKFEGSGICNSFEFYKNSTGSLPVFDLDAQWLVNLSISLSLVQKLQQRVKRILDIVAALFLLTLFSPLMALIAILIKADSKGPVLYRQKRVGMANQEFTTHKFRTMVADAESQSGPVWARKGDPRTTAVGRVLRKTGMDELPQLFDILRGKMSFVGPRPIRAVFEQEFARSIPFYSLRTMVKPGLTGWGQVGAFDARSPDGPQKRFEHDLFYIHEYSLFLDAVISLKTLKKLLWARGE